MMSNKKEKSFTGNDYLNPCLLYQAIVVKEVNGKGRGVFATSFIASGSIIEVCPVVVISQKDYSLIEKTIIDHYLFEWIVPNDNSALPEMTARAAMSLGYGAVYNHSSYPNAAFSPDFATKTLVFKAEKDILAGEEITCDYGCELWFEVKE